MVWGSVMWCIVWDALHMMNCNNNALCTCNYNVMMLQYGCYGWLSNHIAELVFEHICMVAKAWLSETLIGYLADPNNHAKAGILFKHAAHFSICKGLTLNMISLSSGKKLKVPIPATYSCWEE